MRRAGRAPPGRRRRCRRSSARPARARRGDPQQALRRRPRRRGERRSRDPRCRHCVLIQHKRRSPTERKAEPLELLEIVERVDVVRRARGSWPRRGPRRRNGQRCQARRPAGTRCDRAARARWSSRPSQGRGQERAPRAARARPRVRHGRSALTTRQAPSAPRSAASTAAPWPPPGSAITPAPSARAAAAAAASSVTRRTSSSCVTAASSTSPSMASARSVRTAAGSLLFPPERKGTTTVATPRAYARPGGSRASGGLRLRGSSDCSRRQAPWSPTRAPRTSACRRAPPRPGGRCGHR